MNKFKNKYRIDSTRLKNWNYGAMGSYFITICTYNKHPFFGEIVPTTKKMQLSEIGEIVENEWLKTFEIRQDMKLEMGEFVVMPDHFHAIIIIGENEFNIDEYSGNTMHHVSSSPTSQFGPQSKNLASIVRGFKSSVTTQVRKMGNTAFKWQPRYHEHIIRNSKSFERIQNYIADNPKNWKL